MVRNRSLARMVESKLRVCKPKIVSRKRSLFFHNERNFGMWSEAELAQLANKLTRNKQTLVTCKCNASRSELLVD